MAATSEPRKPEALWRAILGHCTVAAYDFKKHNKNRQKAQNEIPQVIKFRRKTAKAE